MAMSSPKTHKTCSKCRETLPVAAFAKDRNRKDGLYPQCRECTAAYQRHRRERNDMGECTYDGCARPRRYRSTGFCTMHYKRYKKSGSPGGVSALAELRDSCCSYCGAGGKIIHDSTYLDGGLCEMHHGRWRRKRDLGPVDRLTQVMPADGQCTHVMPDGSKCSGAYLAGGLCSLHYTRVSAGRDPDDAGISIRISDADAAQQMREAHLEPLEPYVRSDVKWRCRCCRCDREIAPTLASVRQGSDPCWYCSGSRVDPAEAEAFMLSKGLAVIDPWPGRVDRKWRGFHVGTSDKPGCMGEVSPTYHSVKTHNQGVCFDCGERGYTTSKAGAFYVVGSKSLVKCGIANMRNFRTRISQHRRQGLEWEWLIGSADGSVAWQMEREWKMFRAQSPHLHITKDELRDGYTEAMQRQQPVERFLLALQLGA